MMQDQLKSQMVQVLAGHEFFLDWPSAVLERLAAHARRANFAASERIFSKGDEGHGLLVVLSGIVRISLPTEDGREIVLNLIPRDGIFGEIALLDGKPRTADATALSTCKVAILDRRDFLAVLSNYPPMSIKLLEVLSRRLRRTTQQVGDLSSRNIPARLARALLGLAEVQQASEDGRLRIRMTQKALGSVIGLSRETTNRYLREWAEAGYITLDKGLCILNRPDQIALLSGGEDA